MAEASNEYMEKAGLKAYNNAMEKGGAVLNKKGHWELPGAGMEKLKGSAAEAQKAVLESKEVAEGAKLVGDKAAASTGLLTKLGSAIGSLGPYGAIAAAAIAAIAATIWMAAGLITTSKERFEQLNKQLEQNK